MLRTNSKAVITKIHEWIVENGCSDDDYEDMPIPQGNSGEWTIEQFDELATWILKTAASEKFYSHYKSRFDMFHDWAQGLPRALNTADYHYCHPAIDILGDILEETPVERNRFTEEEAIRQMDWLVFRELEKGERRYKNKKI